MCWLRQGVQPPRGTLEILLRVLDERGEKEILRKKGNRKAKKPER